MKIETLLEKAKKQTNKKRTTVTTKEKLEVVIAYLKGEIKFGQMTSVLPEVSFPSSKIHELYTF